VRLDRDGAYCRPKVLGEQANLSAYPRPVRQLIVTGLGRDAATVIITNDQTSSGSATPTSPTPPSPGGAADNSTSNSTDKLGSNSLRENRR